MIFNHVDVDLPNLKREVIDGVRYYKIEDIQDPFKAVSITSVISHYNKEIFEKWRKNS